MTFIIYDSYATDVQETEQDSVKVSREQVVENREKILKSAGRLFRERGFDGVSVSDLMKDAGLTHGGFYGHFPSKQDLAAAASEYALAGSIERWTKAIEGEQEEPLAALSRSYLSGRHRDHPGTGCLFAAVGQEAARHPEVKTVVTNGLRQFVKLLHSIVPGRSTAARRRNALAACATLVGGMVLARAVDDPDFSDEILRATGRSLLTAELSSQA